MEITTDQLKTLYKSVVKPALMAQLATVAGLAHEGAKPTQVSVDVPTLYTTFAKLIPVGEGGLADNTYISAHLLYIPASDKVKAEAQMESYLDAIPYAIRSKPGLGIGANCWISDATVFDVKTIANRFYTVLAWTSAVNVVFDWIGA